MYRKNAHSHFRISKLFKMCINIVKNEKKIRFIIYLYLGKTIRINGDLNAKRLDKDNGTRGEMTRIPVKSTYL